MAGRGIALAWSDAAVAWLGGHGPGGTRGRAWERYVDEVLGRAIAARVEAAEAAGDSPIRLRVVADGDGLRVEDDAPAGEMAEAGSGSAGSPGVDPAGPDGRT